MTWLYVLGWILCAYVMYIISFVTDNKDGYSIGDEDRYAYRHLAFPLVHLFFWPLLVLGYMIVIAIPYIFDATICSLSKINISFINVIPRKVTAWWVGAKKKDGE